MESRSLRQYNDEALVGKTASTAPERRRDWLALTSRTVGLLVKLTFLAILLVVLIGLLDVVGVGGRTTTGVGESLSAAFAGGTRAVAGAVQSVRDLGDPAHPPRGPLTQDTELDELMRLDVGSQVLGSADRTVIVTSVGRREDADSPDASIFAVVHTELRQPREVRIFGVVVRTDTEPRDHYLYKGETFRVGRRLYKVNWVSLDRQQVAIGAYREPDRVTAPRKLEAD